ncbi:DUF4132 domain-containing protein [Actinomadura madurae]|uniref:DUF4132 domain-containing protein n=1 Tax=Actinomadura madurae TaxID=1993 RepID=UPI0035584597
MSDDLRAHQDAPNAPPAHGLGRDGTLVRDVGGYQAVIAITDPLTVRLAFIGADGHPLPTVPGALKVPFAAQVKELKTLARQIRATLAAERGRVEALMAVERTWPYARWCRHHRDHPVTGMVARGLVWEFETPDGLWRAATPGEDVLVTVDGRALPVPAAGARVRLWHPVRAFRGAVRAWRDFVTGNRMTQSFPQAFRETYRTGAPGAGAEPRGAGPLDGEIRRVLAEGGWRVGRHPGHGGVRFERRVAAAGRRRRRRTCRRWCSARGCGRPTCSCAWPRTPSTSRSAGSRRAPRSAPTCCAGSCPARGSPAAARSTAGSSWSAAGCAPTGSTSRPGAC